ncbi:UNVERIFIED_CONTAM: hypothetical protein RMT77_006383 [Armadillidium vulgare]
MEKENGFGVFNYSAFVGMLAVSLGIGLYTAYKGNKSPEEFLMGNRVLKTIPVSMSLLTSFISALNILGFAGETYANGMQISTITFGPPLAILFSSYFILPILFPLKLTSINEYIELRFRSKILRFFISFLMIVNTLVNGGIILYAPTLALSAITKVSTLTCIMILGTICTLYSSFGGIRAVIWTDVFQLLVMIIGQVAVAAVGCAQNGGLIETLHIASERGRLEVFNMSLSPFVRHTFFNTIVQGFIFNLRVYSADQVYIQRICAVKSFENAKSVLKITLISKFAINCFGILLAIAIYATYAGCDPMTLGKIKKKDEIMTYFVMDKLSLIPGLPGLFVAAIIGASLSTLSSFINSCVALLWKDACLKIDIFKNTSQFYATLINKILSLVVGTVLIGLAIIASNTKHLMELGLICGTSLNGPLLGLFLIGFFIPNCNLKGIWAGIIGSTVFTCWLVIGGLIYKKPTKMLPFSTDECVALNFSSVNISSFQEGNSSTYNSDIEGTNDDMSFIMSLYQISYTLYGVTSIIVCVLLAVVVSYITGNLKGHEVSPKYVSSYVHKLFWTKEELDAIRQKELNLDDGVTEELNNQTLNFSMKSNDNDLDLN